MAANPSLRTTRDHRLYTWFAIAMPLVVLLGFARTYYLKGVFSGPTLPSFLVHVHGAVMTSWVLLFIVQVWLVSTRRTKVHQRLGMIGSVLALLVITIGTTTALVAAARDYVRTPEAVRFLVIPLGDMLMFALFVGGALYFRRRLETHKRLMLLGAVAVLPAAIARIPLKFIENGGALAFFGLTDLFLIAFVLLDTIKHRKLHPVFLWGTIVFIALQPVRMFLASTNVWMHVATWLVGLVK